jgi:hypothetical protein
MINCIKRGSRRSGLCTEKVLTICKDPQGKWTSNYEESNDVKKVFFDRALIITTTNGNELPLVVNSDAVNGFYA